MPAAETAGGGAFLMLTSGTTGGPKVAVVEHRCLLSCFLSRRDAPPARVQLVCFPFDRVTGLWIIFPSPADNVFLQPDRLAARPLDLLKIVEELRIERAPISSSIAARILEALQDHPQNYDLSSLQGVTFGAETIVPSIVSRLGMAFRRMGAATLSASFGYGMTETSLICQTPDTALDQIADRPNLGANPVSVGGCTAGFSLRIVDDEGKATPPGTAGNIEVWSREKLFSGYRNDPGLTRASFTKDGWFKTGDQGVVEGGGLTLTGRQAATIIINAKNFSLEAIEAPVRQIEGICRSLVVAAAVRGAASATDELAIFFAPRSDDAATLDDLCRSIVRQIARHSGVTVKHLVPIRETDFPLTATGKIRREELVQLYQSGKWAPHRHMRPEAGAGKAQTARQSWLIELWKTVLKLDSSPSVQDNFFDLGGDSLASAQVIIATEEKFSCRLPIEDFFQSPTIATLDTLVEQHGGLAPSSAPLPEGAHQILRKLQVLTSSWSGDRRFPESLVMSFNSAGSRPPIFWVFQEGVEFAQLAKHLGPDQPLYGMRSCVGLVDIAAYPKILEAVCNRYLWEILALSVRAPFIVGGNCQGGIISLELARKLTLVGRRPSLLVLMEWTYAYGRYGDPTLLLYGDQSHTAEIYLQKTTPRINWREDFPQSSVAPIPGKHGEFFTDENVPGLAGVLSRHCRRQ